ncbi:MAG TPA: hypothetical protein VEL03_08900 [Streptosporangiaceae bacterium]|nr:hypothetical protein [Streptosporangiaceae bacterium]
MAGRGDTPEGPPFSPDDINSRLDEVAAELASEAHFKEPSAAERARAAAARQAQQGGQPRAARRAAAGRGPLQRWRNRRESAGLQQPVTSAGSPATGRPRPLSHRRARGAAARPVPDRGYATPSSRSFRARPLVGVLILIAALFALSVVLHALLH